MGRYMEKVSVVIITFNEEKNIERCLESVRWADEIVVVDTFSTDRTVEICRRFTDRVFQESWRGYGLQKNLCASKANNRWVLNVDADEVISPECAEAIRDVLASELKHPVYRFPRKNFFGNRWIRYAGWYPDLIARLYDRTCVAFSESVVHERLIPDSDAGLIEQPILHFYFDGMEDYVSRQNRYSSLYAEERFALDGRPTGPIFTCALPGFFLKPIFSGRDFAKGFWGYFCRLRWLFIRT